VGRAATRAEVTLYYQTASREYVEFLRDEDVTTAAGGILHDLWSQVDRSTPVAMASLLVERSARNARRCRQVVGGLQRRYRAVHRRAWTSCFAKEAGIGACDTAARDTRLAAADAVLRDKLGGARDAACAGASLTPASLGHEAYCPRPCGDVSLFAVDGLATCALCIAGAVNDAALGAAYGAPPPSLPQSVPPSALACLRKLERAAIRLAETWSDALVACERSNVGKREPRVCADDPDGRIRRAKARAASVIRSCAGTPGLRGCAASTDPSAAQACFEAAIGPVATGYAEVAVP
jgi:hypothetical protein